MKKIINRKKYDTRTAECLAEFNHGNNYSDFTHWGETLYKKSNGEFFLYGEGGPMSKYAKYYGNETSGSEEIFPLTLEQAKDWVEEYCSGEEFEEIFGEISE